MPGARDVDDAVRRARLVVGLGDPDVTWSVLLRLRLARPVDRAGLEQRLAVMLAAFPHLGRVAGVVATTRQDEELVLCDFADRTYGDRDPLLRVALAEDGRSLLLGCHHGVVDGLGMLGVASRLLGVEVTSDARGRADESAGGFVGRAAARLVAATVRPPARLHAGSPDGESSGDHLRAIGGSALSVSSATLVLAAARLVGSWNAGRRARTGRVSIAVGISRRPGRPVPPPDRETGLVMVQAADGVRDLLAARRLLAQTTPEPAYPARDGHTLAPSLVSRLQARVAATIGISNLGRISGDGVERADFWPVAAGPTGIALGLASTSGSTALTTRVPRRWFGAEDTDRLTGDAWAELQALAGSDLALGQ
ncbi:MAG: hypothetical protein ACR2K3_11120 [Nocardioides sp.]